MGKDRLDAEGDSPGWLLFAEDDALFSSLFCRFFRKRFPGVELVTATSLEGARGHLRRSPVPPLYAVLDFHLEDGSSTDLHPDLQCSYLIWSASPEPGLRAKPSGRESLEKAIGEIGDLAGLELLSNRGSAMREKE